MNLPTKFDPGTPFCHCESWSNRRLSARLVMARSASWMKAGESLVLAGDLNARLGSDLVQRVEKSGFDFPPVEGSIYHFNVGLDLFGAIDHLAHANRLVPVQDPVVVRNKAYRLDP